MANVDYTRALMDYQNAQALQQKAMRPYRRAGLGTALATALSGYVGGKNMQQAQHRMGVADKAEGDARKVAMSEALGAYREDTPFEYDRMEGEAPIEGLRNIGTGQNVNALAQSMMGSGVEGMDATGMGILAREQNSGGGTATMQEYHFLNTLPEEEQKRFMAIKRAPGAKVINLGDKIRVMDGTGALLGEWDIATSPDKDPDFMAEGAQAQAAAKGQVERWDNQMDEGLRAADGIPVITRSLALLNKGIETGGWDNLKLSFSNFFGVTGADEAELSANLGRAVLSQLRSTFGAAFTEREGDRLARIEAGFGKSTEANKRLLQELDTMARREAKRGIRAAKRAGDDDFAAEIQALLDYQIEDGFLGETAQTESGALSAEEQAELDALRAEKEAGKF